MSWTNVGKITEISRDCRYIDILEDSHAQAGYTDSTGFELNSHAADQAERLELEVGDHVAIESNRDSYAGRSVGIRLAGVSGRDLQKRLARIEEKLGLEPLDYR